MHLTEAAKGFEKRDREKETYEELFSTSLFTEEGKSVGLHCNLK